MPKYNLDIKHILGVDNVIDDELSRIVTTTLRGYSLHGITQAYISIQEHTHSKYINTHNVH